MAHYERQGKDGRTLVLCMAPGEQSVAYGFQPRIARNGRGDMCVNRPDAPRADSGQRVNVGSLRVNEYWRKHPSIHMPRWANCASSSGSSTNPFI
jgi:hypothetical protein